jgi:hypothetical protein
MIQTLEVYLGGRKMNHITDYNQIFNLLSTHAWGGEHQTYRQSFVNNWVNGRTSLQNSMEDVEFCCQKWLGLLGLPVVLDTEKLGQLHVRITLAPSFVTTSNNGNHSWGVYDLYMKARYYDHYNGELPRYLEWDDYKTLLTVQQNLSFTEAIKVFSSRINWALCKVLRGDARTKNSVLDGNIGSTIAFGSPHQLQFGGLWNIAVNNNNIFRYRPNMTDALLSLQDIFGTQSANYGLTAANSSQTTARVIALGSKIGFVNEIPQEVEISFTVEGQAGVPCFPLMIVNTTASLEIAPNGQVIHNV